MELDPTSNRQLARALAKPGHRWLETERRTVFEWLLSRRQSQHWELFALHRLPHTATIDDACDLWQDFCVNSLPGVIDNFDPDKGRFEAYLARALYNFCSRFRSKIERRLTSVPLFPAVDHYPECTVELRAGVVGPDRCAETKDLTKKLLNALPARFRAVVVLRYLLGLTVSEIALEAGATENTVKTWLFRARHAMRRKLAQMGGFGHR